MNWGEKKLLLKKPLLIDGLSRSGKSILSGIVPSLKNSEQINSDESSRIEKILLEEIKNN